MQPREAAWSLKNDTPDAARARLAGALQRSGHALSDAVRNAFAQVPRHVFVPEVGAAAAYRDEALVIKLDDDGLPVSSSSQPAMMAIMLDQLDLQRGHRVLEIGTGSGYNAAVMSAVVGPRGQVSTVDIDAELAARARDSLAAAGFSQVIVRCADGGYGDPAGAPFDRIIVTAGAWDIAPAWLDQLAPDGRLVLPLSVRGIQLSVALARAGQHWLSMSAWRCGFVRMLGAFAGPETVLQLDRPHALVVQMADGAPADGAGLQRALARPAAEAAAVASPVNLAEIGDLDLWLTLTDAELDRMALLAAPGGWLSIAPLLPFGGLISDADDADRVGVAVVLPSDYAAGWPVGRGAGSRPAVSVLGFGPGGPALAAGLAGRARQWLECGRPGAHDLRLAVQQRPGPESGPAGGGSQDRPDSPPLAVNSADGTMLLRRPSVLIEAGWPPA